MCPHWSYIPPDRIVVVSFLCQCCLTITRSRHLPELTPEMLEYLKGLVQKRGRGLRDPYDPRCSSHNMETKCIVFWSARNLHSSSICVDQTKIRLSSFKSIATFSIFKYNILSVFCALIWKFFYSDLFLAGTCSTRSMGESSVAEIAATRKVAAEMRTRKMEVQYWHRTQEN